MKNRRSGRQLPGNNPRPTLTQMPQKRGLVVPFLLVTLGPALILVICTFLATQSKLVKSEDTLGNGFATATIMMFVLYFVTMIDNQHGYMKPLISAGTVSLVGAWVVFKPSLLPLLLVVAGLFILTIITAHFLKEHFKTRGAKTYLFVVIATIISFCANLVVIMTWHIAVH